MFVPIYDTNPLEHVSRPYVTWGLIAVNAFVFLALQHGGFGEVSQAGVLGYGTIPAVITGEAVLPDGYERLPPQLTLVSYMFLHAGWLHILGNMAFLYVFGDNVEDALGHARFLAFYLLCGILAGATHIFVDPGSEVPLIGASGAVAGVIAAYLVLHPSIRLWALVFMKIPLRVPAYLVIGLWLTLQIYQIATATDVETAWWAHIGGFVAGGLLVTVMRRRGVALFDRDPSGVPTARGASKGER